MRDRLKGKSVVITKERARSIRPILLWIKKISTRQKIRFQAASILKEIEGIEDYKQVILSRGEADLLTFVFSEWPEGVDPEGKQLSLFSQTSESTRTIREAPKFATGHAPSGEKVDIPIIEEVKEEPPSLKAKLTEREQEERDETIRRLGYEPKPTSYFEDIMRESRRGEK